MIAQAVPAVSVIVAARDAAQTLPATLAALAAQRLEQPFEVIVVDNGSRDDTAAIAQTHPLSPQVLRRERGDGPGAARNAGAAVALAPILAFTDSDCAPAPGWLAAALAAFASTGADLVQGAVSPPPGSAVGPFDHTVWVSAEHGLYQTANLLLRREHFDAVGGFEDWLAESQSGPAARPFGEDAWLAWRMRRAGARTAFCADAVVHHAVIAGTARDYLAERGRDRLFALMAQRIPELRASFHHRRHFMSRRSAAFDGALFGVVVAVAARHPLPLLAAIPYANALRRETIRRTGVFSGRVAVVVVAGDAIGAVALARGSAQARELLI